VGGGDGARKFQYRQMIARCRINLPHLHLTLNFRTLCSELQSRIEILLLLHPNDDDDEGVCVVGGAAANSTADDGNYGAGGVMISKNKNYNMPEHTTPPLHDGAKDGSNFDCILDYVRSLRRHCLSSSSMMNAATSENSNMTTPPPSINCYPIYSQHQCRK